VQQETKYHFDGCRTPNGADTESKQTETQEWEWMDATALQQ